MCFLILGGWSGVVLGGFGGGLITVWGGLLEFWGVSMDRFDPYVQVKQNNHSEYIITTTLRT